MFEVNTEKVKKLVVIEGQVVMNDAGLPFDEVKKIVERELSGRQWRDKLPTGAEIIKVAIDINPFRIFIHRNQVHTDFKITVEYQVITPITGVDTISIMQDSLTHNRQHLTALLNAGKTEDNCDEVKWARLNIAHFIQAIANEERKEKVYLER